MTFWKMWGVKSRLRSADPAKRKSAIDALMKTGECSAYQHLSLLLEALGDTDESVWDAAFTVVNRLLKGSWARGTLAALREPQKYTNPEGQKRAASLLRVAAESALRTLEFASKVPPLTASEFCAAAELLADMGDLRALASLMSVLKSGSMGVAWEAATALGHFGPRATDAIPALTAGLLADDRILVEHCAVSIGRIAGTDEAAIRLLAASTTRKMQGKTAVV